MRRAFLISCSAACLAATSGCEGLRKLRRAFHPEEANRGRAGLHVTVEPAQGIEIQLDGQILATRSPFESRELVAGTHELRIVAKGYQSFLLPVRLVDGETVRVPVALRRAPASTTTGTTTPRPRQVSRPPQLAPPAPPAPLSPPGVDPIAVVVTAKPEVPVTLDGIVQPQRTVTLARVRGTIAAGSLEVDYELAGEGALRLRLPGPTQAGATWTRDGEAWAPGDTFKLHRGVTRLRLTTADGTDQTLLLRRVN